MDQRRSDTDVTIGASMVTMNFNHGNNHSLGETYWTLSSIVVWCGIFPNVQVVLNVPETRVDDAEFQENGVYALDMVSITREGRKSFCCLTNSFLVHRFVIES
ncbi:hypothetical protein C5167_019270 [Papaver somniferum]|uniref:Uncharacterized protein n=1 Tax=Papaver somniferum TaxID=3469 RepID=A0A4Y7ISR5_PAPSO|nr:hypothetical protein C5167_019270 [Papaver somniferum]